MRPQRQLHHDCDDCNDGSCHGRRESQEEEEEEEEKEEEEEEEVVRWTEILSELLVKVLEIQHKTDYMGKKRQAIGADLKQRSTL